VRWRTSHASLLVVCLVAVIAPTEALAQGLSLDVSAGRTVYDAIAANVSTNNVMGTLRYDGRRGVWVYGTAAGPLRSGDPVWGAFGTGGRFLPAGSGSRRANIGVDLGAHGFLFRDVVVDRTGRGVTLDALPFVRVTSGDGSLELRGGWRGHTLSYAGATENRGVFETGGHATYGAAVRVEMDARWVRATEGAYPFVGGTLLYGGAPVQAWVSAGKWLSADLDDVAWHAGISVALGSQTMLWANLRQEAPDPLYWNAARRSWGIGLTRRLGRGAPAQMASRQEPGGVLIRLSVSDAPGTELAIAGDFNNWQPMPMQREGDEWMIRLPLAPGVYHYAFRSGKGDWFVPASVQGRRDDGMGGHVAVLVVS
jgi:hypothetical protein